MVGFISIVKLTNRTSNENYKALNDPALQNHNQGWISLRGAAVVEKKKTQGKIAGYNQICKIAIFGMRYGNVIAVANRLHAWPTEKNNTNRCILY